MEQTVEFHVMSRRFSIQVVPEKKGFDSFGVLSTIPARIISFEDGRYTTDDPAIIEAIRKSSSYKTKKIIEITEADRDAFRPKPEQQTIRGPISTASIQAEAGVKPDEKTAGLRVTSSCKVCGKEFKDDLGGKRVRLHEISHRRGKPQGASVEEK